jgi:hypothetical protein
MKLRERKRNGKTVRKKRGQFRYNSDSAQSESFKLKDYLLAPCSVPRAARMRKTAWVENDSYKVEYDATPSFIASHRDLTPKRIDRLYQLTLQTSSLECAAWMICIPYFTVQGWLSEGKKYAEDVASGRVPRRKHSLQYELYLRINQAKFLKLGEKRARILQNKGDAGAFRTLKVLEALDTGDFGFSRGKGMPGSDALPLADEAYM